MPQRVAETVGEAEIEAFVKNVTHMLAAQQPIIVNGPVQLELLPLSLSLSLSLLLGVCVRGRPADWGRGGWAGLGVRGDGVRGRGALSSELPHLHHPPQPFPLLLSPRLCAVRAP
eukprot:313523-Rhodomonas_salina.1